MIQSSNMLAGGQGLSVEERLKAASDGLRDFGTSGEDLLRLVVVVAVVALVVMGALLVLGRVRRVRRIARHLNLLRAVGLQGEELALFRALARRSDSARVPLLVRNRGAFDAAAGEHVHHFAPADGRRDELSLVLSLRRRIPFDHRWKERPEIEVGAAVTFVLRLDAQRVRQIEGRVLGAPPDALQVGLQPGPADREAAERLRTGQEVLIVVRRGVEFREARVRIRGRCMGRTLQVLIDRPVALTASRVKIAWRGAAEPVQVELVERFSERLADDDVPRHAATLVATASDGVVLRFKNVRPRHGEAIRVLAGAHAGFYRGYAVLAASGKGGEVFVMRRQGDRTNDRAAAMAEASAKSHSA
jgi:hypothetical protein